MSLSKAASSTQLNPICIIDLNNPDVNGIDALRKLLSTVEPGCELVCISIAGRRRGGKSSLLCLFIRYLEARCRTEQRGQRWMEHARDEELEGFSSEHGTTSVTRGILFWPKLFKIEENIAVLLMDTQGIFDQKSTFQNDTILISLSLLLSSVQIFNIKGDLDRDCLENLNIFTEVARLVLGDESADLENSPRPFQELIILLRDWENKRQFNYGWAGGQDRLRVSRHEASALTWNKVSECFENDIQCFLMPRPGDEIVEDGSRRLTDMRPIFKEKVKELIEGIFLPREPQQMKFNGVEITCGTFADITKLCIDKLKSGKSPIVRDIVSSVAQHMANKLVETLKEEHRNTIAPLDKECPFEPADLETYLKNEEEKILKKFDSSRKIEVGEIIKETRETLAKAIRSDNDTLKSVNAAARSVRRKAGAVVGGVIGGIGGGIGGGILAGPPGIAAGYAAGASVGAGIGTVVGHSLPLAKISHRNSSSSDDDSKLPLLEQEGTEMEALIKRDNKQSLR